MSLEVLRDLASEYRLAVRYAIEVLEEIEAVLVAEDRPVLRALVASMRDELDAHMALSYLLEEAAAAPPEATGSGGKSSVAMPEPPEEEPIEPIPA